MRSKFTGYLACAIAFSTLATAGKGGGELLISNPQGNVGDLFGISVAAVGTDKVIVGTPGEDTKATDDGVAHLFDLSGNLLQTYGPEQFTDLESFGAFVTGVGNTSVLISATQDPESIDPTLPGVAYLYDISGSFIESFSNPTSSVGDGFGPSAALGSTMVVIGAPGDDTDGTNTGRAYVFTLGDKGGPQIISNPSPLPGDGFGSPVAALGSDRVAISMLGDTDIFVFQIPSGDLVTTITLDSHITSLAWVPATDQLLVGSEDAGGGKVPAGEAYLYDSMNGDLDLTIPNPFPGFDDAFGISVAVLGNGTLAVGADLDNPGEAEDAGTVYLFDTAGTLLDTLNKATPVIGDQFGFATAAVGCNQLVIGTPQGDDIDTAVGPGEAWVFSNLAGGNCEEGSNNYVEIFLERIDDFEQSGATFRAEVNVVIPDNPGVLGVQFAVGEVSLFLAKDEADGDDHWTGSFYFIDLNQFTNNFNGLGIIETFGSASSGGGNFTTTSFTLDTAKLLESDFFATPTDIDPANDAIDVSIDTNFSWTDPTGKDTPDILAVNSDPLDGGAGSQEDNSLFGSLSVTDTTWDPPQDLLSGANRFEVAYLSFDDAMLASTLVVEAGVISWGDSPIAPKGYPGSTALVTLGASTRVGFGVGSGTVGFDPPDITPAAGVPEHEATGDFDGDGDTDVVVTIPDLDPSLVGNIQVFLNLGNDEFGEWLGFEALDPMPVGREPSWVTVGDFNADALPDICVTNAGDDNVSIFLNTGNGTFGPEVNVFVGDGPSACTTAQFNTDTDFFLDIAVTNANDENLVVLFNDGAGGFTLGGGAASSMPPLDLRTAAMTTGDFDGNKCPDAVGAGEATLFNGTIGRVFVLLGKDDGTFEPPIFITVGADPSDISVGDVNGDTFNDIVVANRGDGTITIVPGLGGGLFDTPITIPVGAMPRSIDVINLDSDNDPDIAVVADDPDIGPSVQVLVNRSQDPIGFGSSPIIFDAPLSFDVGGNPNFVVHTDLDQDGNSDLCMVNQDGAESGSVSVLLTNLLPEGLEDCPGDFNGDGFVNVVDLFLLLAAWGPCDTPCDADLDGDSHVGILDLLGLLHLFGPCVVDLCPWDVNGDDVVDFTDFWAVIENIGFCADPFDCPWDIDGDGFVSITDALIVLANFGPCPE